MRSRVCSRLTCIAVGVAQFPYWMIRNPSEVIKVRQQTSMETKGGNATSAWQVVWQTLQQGDRNDDTGSSRKAALTKDLYTGYWENLLYAYPADVLKFVIYEVLLTQGQSDLSPLKGAQAGAVATAMAQLVTTPLDVVRNRLMMTSPSSDSKNASASDKDSPLSYWDRLVALANDEGLEGLFAGAAPRVGKAILSGAIQFATYEETKQSILKLLMGAVTGGDDGGGGGGMVV
ncbi:MAG: hypothetical protein SGARI_002696 [Bacillariaceae sp.]